MVSSVVRRFGPPPPSAGPRPCGAGGRRVYNLHPRSPLAGREVAVPSSGAQTFVGIAVGLVVVVVLALFVDPDLPVPTGPGYRPATAMEVAPADTLGAQTPEATSATPESTRAPPRVTDVPQPPSAPDGPTPRPQGRDQRHVPSGRDQRQVRQPERLLHLPRRLPRVPPRHPSLRRGLPPIPHLR